MGKGTKIQQPDPIDPGKAMGEYLFGSDFGAAKGVTDPVLQNRLIEAERTFRPQYTALELAEQEAALFGRDGQMGLIGLQERASREFAPIEEAAKEREIERLRRFGGQVTEAFREADPQATRLADLAAKQAETLYSEAEGELSPERRRMAEQSARAGSLSRGRIGDQSSIAAELLGREQVRSGLRAEARQAGAGAFQQTQQVGADPSQFLFGRPSQFTQMGSGLYGQAFNLAGQQAGPQLFDPNVGINMAMQRQSNQYNLLGAQAQADASRSAGIMSGLGSALGAFTLPCWVAREVYGIENPKWIMFRTWLLNDAPSWFRNLYIKHGESFAKFISNKPVLKTIIRKWMNTRIK
jgi:hypothetical protein|tara:strand:+ start:2197 stop:3255 length:1059 start_codon:yes stop_codon:yes gene_type:complete